MTLALENSRETVSLPSVSVVIPCYNGDSYLGQAIDSVLAQSWYDFEVIVVDDGSTDNTAEVTRSYCDQRIRYEYQANRGLANARNTGIRLARGKYLAFLDADDTFLPAKLQLQITYLNDHPEVGLLVGGFLRIDAEGNVLYESRPPPGVISPEDVLVASRFPVHASLVRKTWVQRVGYFDERLSAAEDWDFHCRLAIMGCKMHVTEDIVCAYRLLPGAMSTDPERQTRAMLQVVEKTFASGSLASSLAELEAEAFGYTHLKGAIRHFGAGLIDAGRHHLAQALQWDPGLSEDGYQKVLPLLLFWIDHMQMDSPVQYLETVFRNLPEQAQGLRKQRRSTLYSWRKKELLSAWRKKEQIASLKLACWMILTNPSEFLRDLVRSVATRADLFRTRQYDT